MFFAYGSENETLERFLAEAYNSASRIRAVDPSVNITLVTNPDRIIEEEGVFDVVVHVKDEDLFSGRVPSWSTGGMKSIPKQWLTRLLYMSQTPYEVTLALDSQALLCAGGVNDILSASLDGYDVAIALQGALTLHPHNWAIMFRMNERTERMFHRWKVLQWAYSKTSSDQGTLYVAAGTLALQDKLRVGILGVNLGMAYLKVRPGGADFPKSTQLLGPGPAHFIHAAANIVDGNRICAQVNQNTSVSRMFYIAGPHSGSAHDTILWQPLYSRQEVKQAAKKAGVLQHYFWNIMWRDEEGRPWQDHLPFVTPWLSHFPDADKKLREEMDERMKVLLSKDLVLRSEGFHDEFENDEIWTVPPVDSGSGRTRWLEDLLYEGEDINTVNLQGFE
ncbi:unnamed protein product [Choristocarpus tenellus]